MEPFSPLASDADAPGADLGLAQARCALALGRLDGLVAGLDNPEKALFCRYLLRDTLISALAKSGYADTGLGFDRWFAGLARAPRQTPVAPYPAHAIVRALLAELGRHPWAPLSEAAQAVASAARFATDGLEPSGPDAPEDALEAARALVGGSPLPSTPGLPFAALARLNDDLRRSALFAPVERGAVPLPLGGRQLSIERAGLRTPLWAIDALLGLLAVSCGTWRLALPCPGAVTAEALQPPLWPNERGIVAASSLAASAERMIRRAEMARSAARRMVAALGHLRSSARAPQVWIMLAGFAPLCVDQIEAAFSVSRRGTYAIRDALLAASLARVETIKGKVVLAAVAEHERSHEQPADGTGTLPSPLLAEFDAAMEEIDRLLSRQNV